MLYYKLTEADRVYYIELLADDLDNSLGEKFYFQCQFLKADDSPIYQSARYVVGVDEQEMQAFERNGFNLLDTYCDIDKKGLVQQCFGVIEKIKSHPKPLLKPRDN